MAILTPIAASFRITPIFPKTDLGTSNSSTLITTGPWAGYELIATEKWTPNFTETLNLTIVGATYYDSNASSTNYQSNATAIASGVTIIYVPEATSLSMLGLGAIALFRCQRSTLDRN